VRVIEYDGTQYEVPDGFFIKAEKVGSDTSHAAGAALAVHYEDDKRRLAERSLSKHGFEHALHLLLDLIDGKQTKAPRVYHIPDKGSPGARAGVRTSKSGVVRLQPNRHTYLTQALEKHRLIGDLDEVKTKNDDHDKLLGGAGRLAIQALADSREPGILLVEDGNPNLDDPFLLAFIRKTLGVLTVRTPSLETLEAGE
jgi:hypothetical protein